MRRVLRRGFADKVVGARRPRPNLLVKSGVGVPGLEARAQAGVVRRFREADEPGRGFLLGAFAVAVWGFCHARLARIASLINKRVAARIFQIVIEKIFIRAFTGRVDSV